MSPQELRLGIITSFIGVPFFVFLLRRNFSEKESHKMQKEKQSIKASELSYGVNGKTIVADASFEIEKNEFLCVIGPNGAGKSTLLRLLTRILNPSEGRILLDGKDLRQYEAKKLYRKISFLPRHPISIFR